MTLRPLLVALILISPTVQYRFAIGPVSFALMEPLTLAAAAVLLIGELQRRRTVVLAREPLWPLLLLICAWSVVVRPFGENPTRGLSDARDWLIPTLGYLTIITTVRTGWRRWSLIPVVNAVLQSVLGIYQVLTNSARPFVNISAVHKTGFTIAPDAAELERTSFAVGFFVHPNMMAISLFGALMLLLTLPGRKRREQLLTAALIIPVAASLYLTYAKASLAVMAAALIWYGARRLIRSDRLRLLLGIGAALLLLVTLPLLLETIPYAYLETFYWRVDLWRAAAGLIEAQPTILLHGNGMELFGRTAQYNQPHNNYIYMTLEYGLFGLFWLIALTLLLLIHGWWAQRLGDFRAAPQLNGLWIFLVGLLAISLVESTLQGIEARAILLGFFACYIGLIREVRSERVQARRSAEDS